MDLRGAVMESGRSWESRGVGCPPASSSYATRRIRHCTDRIQRPPLGSGRGAAGMGGGTRWQGRRAARPQEAMDHAAWRRWQRLETRLTTGTATEDAVVNGARRQPGATSSSTASWPPTSGSQGQFLGSWISHPGGWIWWTCWPAPLPTAGVLHAAVPAVGWSWGQVASCGAVAGVADGP